MLLKQSEITQLGEMTDIIAHQWKQPLYQINSILLMLERHYAEQTLTPEVLEGKLNEIEMLTTHMALTVDNFKNFLHPSHTTDFFDISEAVQSAIDLIASEFDRLEIVSRFEKIKNCQVSGSKEEFIHALLTILSNAKECFSHRHIPNPRIDISIEDAAHEVIITINDNAGGIPAEFVNKIFDLYFTTKIHGHGTGLGLYIAKMLIEKSMRGTITAENSDTGARFLIYLPKERCEKEEK